MQAATLAWEAAGTVGPSRQSIRDSPAGMRCARWRAHWQPWCDAHVITDADVFLGGNSSYLMDALLRDRDRDRDERGRLIVLEDAGELLTADARALAGQGLSQLLNLTDGLLGAGMRASVIVTTNEPLGRLHPAVARPGRAWAEVEFSGLSTEEANSWLAGRSCDQCVERPATLAELFALAGGRVAAPRGWAWGSRRDTGMPAGQTAPGRLGYVRQPNGARWDSDLDVPRR